MHLLSLLFLPLLLPVLTTATTNPYDSQIPRPYPVPPTNNTVEYLEKQWIYYNRHGYSIHWSATFNGKLTYGTIVGATPGKCVNLYNSRTAATGGDVTPRGGYTELRVEFINHHWTGSVNVIVGDGRGGMCAVYSGTNCEAYTVGDFSTLHSTMKYRRDILIHKDQNNIIDGFEEGKTPFVPESLKCWEESKPPGRKEAWVPRCRKKDRRCRKEDVEEV